MNSHFLKISMACLVLFFSGSLLFGQVTSKVTFTVDMSGVAIDDPSTVGIRGSLPPLSWEETYPMKGPDKNGMYTASVTFENVPYGTRVQYKYFYGDNVWDNDDYMEFGNRVVPLCSSKQKLPTDTWNEATELAFEPLLRSAANDQFGSWLFTMHLAKKSGMSMEDLAKEHFAFWGDSMDWLSSPHVMIVVDRINMARSPYGYFEVIEDSPDRVEYVVKKDWEIYFREWGKDGQINGITLEEMTHFIKTFVTMIIEKKGWTLDWTDEGDNLKITVSSK